MTLEKRMAALSEEGRAAITQVCEDSFNVHLLEAALECEKRDIDGGSRTVCHVPVYLSAEQLKIDERYVNAAMRQIKPRELLSQEAPMSNNQLMTAFSVQLYRDIQAKRPLKIAQIFGIDEKSVLHTYNAVDGIRISRSKYFGRPVESPWVSYWRPGKIGIEGDVLHIQSSSDRFSDASFGVYQKYFIQLRKHISKVRITGKKSNICL